MCDFVKDLKVLRKFFVAKISVFATGTQHFLDESYITTGEGPLRKIGIADYGSSNVSTEPCTSIKNVAYLNVCVHQTITRCCGHELVQGQLYAGI